MELVSGRSRSGLVLRDRDDPLSMANRWDFRPFTSGKFVRGLKWNQSRCEVARTCSAGRDDRARYGAPVRLSPFHHWNVCYKSETDSIPVRSRLDLFCGTGIIGLNMANRWKFPPFYSWKVYNGRRLKLMSGRSRSGSGPGRSGSVWHTGEAECLRIYT